MDNFATMLRALERAVALVGRLQQRYDALNAAQQEIAKLPMVDASPYWHADKYLYLIHRTTAGYRPRKYVGNNPERVAEALAEIERFKEHARLESEIQRMKTRMLDCLCRLEMFYSKLAEIEK